MGNIASQHAGSPGTPAQLNVERQTFTQAEQAPGVELSIVVPTFNERENVEELVSRLNGCLGTRGWEIIFVDDDSPDGTSELARRHARADRRVRCIQRIGRRGLSSACVEGMLSSSAPYLAVMDGDLQHDETLLPQMLAILREGQADIVIGSRYVPGGGVDAWEPSRVRISRTATVLSRFAVTAELKDPMSGFFMIRREAFEAALRQLSALGFKILLDIFASSPRPLRFVELPYQFRSRHAGESKLDSRAKWDYLMLLLDKLIGRAIPVRFLAFALVGSSGIIVHVAALTLLYRGLNAGFTASQGAAALIAMTTNFALNNALTYRDVRLRGWGWWRGWAIFVLACGVGAVANVGVASYLFEAHGEWKIAAAAGILVGAVWNYATTATYTWNSAQKT